MLQVIIDSHTNLKDLKGDLDRNDLDDDFNSTQLVKIQLQKQRSSKNSDALEMTELVEKFEELNMNQLGKIHLYRLEKDIKIANQLRKREYDSRLEEKECRFSPMINQKSKEIDNIRKVQLLKSKSEQRNGKGKQLQRVELLYEFSKQVQQKIMSQKQQQDEQTMRQATFKPHISEKSRELASKHSVMYSGLSSPPLFD